MTNYVDTISFLAFMVFIALYLRLRTGYVRTFLVFINLLVQIGLTCFWGSISALALKSLLFVSVAVSYSLMLGVFDYIGKWKEIPVVVIIISALGISVVSAAIADMIFYKRLSETGVIITSAGLLVIAIILISGNKK